MQASVVRSELINFIQAGRQVPAEHLSTLQSLLMHTKGTGFLLSAFMLLHWLNSLMSVEASAKYLQRLNIPNVNGGEKVQKIKVQREKINNVWCEGSSKVCFCARVKNKCLPTAPTERVEPFSEHLTPAASLQSWNC